VSAYHEALGELTAMLLGATGNVLAVALDYKEQSHVSFTAWR
jgi:hypothetical protein